ncbi:MAG: acylneuraminate cytidylyltransferase family protein [Deltaproteobacteria bacterium]|nr:acylneuraminate cytidylyltransferase family protein [Deltaproteobacteria bacterium]
MINNKRVLVIVPARGGSKGLPGKNILTLCGKPLVAWPIATAKASKYIDKIVVSTDDLEIAKIAEKYGASVPFIRPAALATDTATTFSVIEHTLVFLKNAGESFDYIVLREPTSPLTESDDIDAALEILESKRAIADSIVGVSKVEAAHPAFDVVIKETGTIKPFMYPDFSQAVRRQDIADIYFFEGSLYISDTETLLEKSSFYHDRTLPYIVPRYKSLEIDEQIDFLFAETILNNIEKINNNA